MSLFSAFPSSKFHCPLYSLFLLLLPQFLLSKATPITSSALFMDRQGCGEMKGCLFKPAGCNPMLDCSFAIIFSVIGQNRLHVQMTAQSLVPAPSLQYVAIGFSNDMRMGDDFVTECVLSPDGSMFNDVDVFASYNLDRTSNDRTIFNATERALFFDDVQGEMVDGRLYCSFVQALRPQFSLSNGEADRVWNLDKKYWIMGATGSAQPDEINAHDTSMGSHFYPIVSSRAIDPSHIGARYYELPPAYGTAKMPPIVQEMRTPPSKGREGGNDVPKGPIGNGDGPRNGRLAAGVTLFSAAFSALSTFFVAAFINGIY